MQGRQILSQFSLSGFGERTLDFLGCLWPTSLKRHKSVNNADCAPAGTGQMI